jgi:hypothetical protein
LARSAEDLRHLADEPKEIFEPLASRMTNVGSALKSFAELVTLIQIFFVKTTNDRKRRNH